MFNAPSPTNYIVTRPPGSAVCGFQAARVRLQSAAIECFKASRELIGRFVYW